MTLTAMLAELKSKLAASEAFQTWCGIDPESEGADAEAETHIALFNVDVETAPDPVCLLYQNSDYERTREGFGFWMTGGSLALHFEQEVDASDSVQERLENIVESVEDIMTDIEGIALFDQWSFDTDDPSITPRNEKRQAAKCLVVAKLTMGGAE